ncbi:MAG: phenylpyruvate tautomerase MIF-related protein [Clostridium sp.]|nr:phenylpyruvate tautomerase MIF-related protein [Clostridium sp.]MDY3827583.1 phenylpyruvate tautomerase MIF-related protein [Clostridium sp.]
MPYIDSKVTINLTDTEMEHIKSELGKIINDIPGKSENYLMIGFQDNYPLFFKGKRLDFGAFIEVKLFGGVTEDYLNKVTQKICNLYSNELKIPQKAIYVKFEEVDAWGWNGKNF